MAFDKVPDRLKIGGKFFSVSFTTAKKSTAKARAKSLRGLGRGKQVRVIKFGKRWGVFSREK